METWHHERNSMLLKPEEAPLDCSWRWHLLFVLPVRVGGNLSSGSSVFVLMAFTGTWPDKLLQHDQPSSHSAAATTYRERQQRLAPGTIGQMVTEADIPTVDKDTFADASTVMHFLNKHEILHTTNYVSYLAMTLFAGLRRRKTSITVYI